VEWLWRERHGPPVVPPRHTGFGTMLLKATFPAAKIEYAPEGLSCQVELPFATTGYRRDDL
jgi:two-component sensor histidine kinase